MSESSNPVKLDTSIPNRRIFYIDIPGPKAPEYVKEFIQKMKDIWI